MGDTLAVATTHHKHHALRILLGAVVILTIGLGIGGLLQHVLILRSQRFAIPQSIAQKAPMPVYIPKKLPGNYNIDKTSFSIRENIVVFQATDDAGGQITFTEQQKPSSLNFNNFYAKQMQNTQTLDQVPFPSVVGESVSPNTDDKTDPSDKNVTTKSTTHLLSIVTDKTWILASTTSPLGSGDLQIIAQSIAR